MPRLEFVRNFPKPDSGCEPFPRGKQYVFSQLLPHWLVSFLLLPVCNFIVHEKCLKTVTLPCYSVAATLVKNPVAHVWTERTLVKGRKFCNVCRKKVEDVMGICCEGQSVGSRKSGLSLQGRKNIAWAADGATDVRSF